MVAATEDESVLTACGRMPGESKKAVAAKVEKASIANYSPRVHRPAVDAPGLPYHPCAKFPVPGPAVLASSFIGSGLHALEYPDVPRLPGEALHVHYRQVNLTGIGRAIDLPSLVTAWMLFGRLASYRKRHG